MTGDTNLAAMLASIEVSQRPGVYAFVSAASTHPAHAQLVAHALATVIEAEGVTYVVPAEVASELGFNPGFEAAWLTLTVHSSLAAVGLTAAVSARLADAGIACNMLAGYYHDHLLVPAVAAAAAIDAIHSLRGSDDDSPAT